MELVPAESLVVEMEAKAAEMARHAGEILRGHFGSRLEIEYKDEKMHDPVTSADKASQAYLCEAISRQFPDHGIIAEEGPNETEAAARDFVWLLDPLDGTTNFLNGLPIYAVSIGVLHRGTPLAGALFVPWPGQHGGFVLHARKGGGACMDGEPISMAQSEGTESNRLVGFPASFGAQFRFRKGLRRHAGAVRMTGSIAYELGLTACGAFEYVIFGWPKIWDVAAGALIVMEAGGAVLLKHRRNRRWEPLTCLGPSWSTGAPTLREIAGWAAPMIAGNAHVVPSIAASLQDRLSLSGRVARFVKGLAR